MNNTIAEIGSNFTSPSGSPTTLGIMKTDTTNLSYWFNWRFLLCAIWLFMAMIFAACLIWKYEGVNNSESDRRDSRKEPIGSLYKHEAWSTCLKTIHPAWLLAFRMIAFLVMLSLLIANVATDGGGIYFFYTQWTFALVTIYFGFASSFSIYGCLQCRSRALDVEQNNYIPPALNGNGNICNISKRSDTPLEETHETAGFYGYALQIIFQMCAGAVLLTDSVFWCIIFPFLTAVDYRLHFMDVSLHSINAVFLLGDTILNCKRFPFFRIAYFVLWTAVFVIFQWIIHACKSMWWPYPFLDLSSSSAPLWYLAVGIMHLPCYGLFALIVKMKKFWLLRSFPDTYRSIT